MTQQHDFEQFSPKVGDTVKVSRGIYDGQVGVVERVTPQKVKLDITDGLVYKDQVHLYETFSLSSPVVERSAGQFCPELGDEVMITSGKYDGQVGVVERVTPQKVKLDITSGLVYKRQLELVHRYEGDEGVTAGATDLRAAETFSLNSPDTHRLAVRKAISEKLDGVTRGRLFGGHEPQRSWPQSMGKRQKQPSDMFDLDWYADGITRWVKGTGKKYHRKGCTKMLLSTGPSKPIEKSLNRLMEEGKEPCMFCSPDPRVPLAMQRPGFWEGQAALAMAANALPETQIAANIIEKIGQEGTKSFT
jgi:ribosomal protein L24